MFICLTTLTNNISTYTKMEDYRQNLMDKFYEDAMVKMLDSMDISKNQVSNYYNDLQLCRIKELIYSLDIEILKFLANNNNINPNEVKDIELGKCINKIYKITKPFLINNTTPIECAKEIKIIVENYQNNSITKLLKNLLTI